MIQICGIIRQSIVDGPGIRFVVFTQGCPHHCPDCHNPQSWPMEGGTFVTADRLLQEIRKNPTIQGLTLSGGEPTLQCEELLPLVREVKKLGLDVVTFSGYTFEQLQKRCGLEGPDHGQETEGEAALRELLHLTDILVDGPYLKEQRDLSLQYRGSKNQRLLDCSASLEAGKAVLWEEEGWKDLPQVPKRI